MEAIDLSKEGVSEITIDFGLERQDKKNMKMARHRYA